MPKKTGICINIGGNCPKAKNKELQTADVMNFKCSHCGRELKEKVEPSPHPWRMIVVIASCVLALGGIGGGAYFLLGGGSSSSPEGITLNKQTTELVIGTTDTLNAVVTPNEAKATLKWASNNEQVVKVTNGVVTAIAPGTAKIGVQVAEKQELKAFCDYTVIGATNPGNVESAMNALATGHIEGDNGSGSISTPMGKYKGELKEGKADGNGHFQFFKSCRITDKDSQGRMAEPGDYISGQFSGNEIVNVKWYDKDGNQKGVIIIGKTGV